MLETVKWAFSRRIRIRHLCYDTWGWCKAKNKMWKKKRDLQKEMYKEGKT